LIIFIINCFSFRTISIHSHISVWSSTRRRIKFSSWCNSRSFRWGKYKWLV